MSTGHGAIVAAEGGTHQLGDFRTGLGEMLRGAELAWRVFGDPALGREHGWILVFHALTGSADVDAWWGPLLGPGGVLDTGRHPVLAANLLGSCYGSTGPAAWSGRAFPFLSTTDMARAHGPLLERLGVERIALATGGSLGGMVALAFAAVSPVPVDRLVVLAAPFATSAQAIAWNAAQRLAIEADPRWAGGNYLPGEGPGAGLAAARAIAMITYRSHVEFGSRFARRMDRAPGTFDVEHYLRRQGRKLVDRFDARSYVALMAAMDGHDLGDPGAAALATRARVREVIGVGIDSDILYLPAEVRRWVEAYQAAGVNAHYGEVTSPYGHDAFLMEWEQVGALLRGQGTFSRYSSLVSPLTARGNSPAPAPGSRDEAGSAPSP